MGANVYEERRAVRERVVASMADETHVRIARTGHRCLGRLYENGAAVPGSRCRRPIDKGTVYVEHCGETAAYQSGDRYHPECAVREGILAPEVGST